MTERSPRRQLAARGWPWLAAAAWAAGLAWLAAATTRYGWPPARLLALSLAWSVAFAVLFRTAVRNLFGPVFTYEVLRLGRRRTTVLYRLLYVLAVMAVLAVMYFNWLDTLRYTSPGGVINPQRQSAFAAEFFAVFQALQYAVVVILTPATVAGAIADEKERKTLEFLLATDLAGQEIVFGKLAARVMTLLMYVLAGLPVVAFLQLFGGIAPELLLAGTAASVVTVLGLSALSIAFSVSLKKPRDAIVLTYVAVAVYGVGAFAAAWLAHGLARMAVTWGTFGVVGGRTVEWVEVMEPLRDAADWLASASAPYAAVIYLESTNGTVTAAGISGVLLKFASVWLVIIAACLLYAVTRLRPVALRQAYGGARRVKRDKQGREVGRWRGRPAVGDAPMVWKEVFVDGSRRSCLGTLLSGIVGLMIFAWPLFATFMLVGICFPGLLESLSFSTVSHDFAYVYPRTVETINTWCRVATGVLTALILLGAAVRGSAAVSGERDRDTWVSLVSTPLTVGEMLWGKFWGVVLGQRKLFGALVAVWAIALAFGAVEPLMILVSALALAVYTAAFAWLGILCSVTAKKTLVATVRAIMAGAFFGGGYLVVGTLCCVVPFGLFVGPRDFDGEPFESLGLLAVGCCPPLVMGWLPMPELTEFDRDLGVFAWRTAAVGPLAPLFGLVLWAAFGLVLASWSFGLFTALANRGEPGRPPKPRAS